MTNKYIDADRLLEQLNSWRKAELRKAEQSMSNEAELRAYRRFAVIQDFIELVEAVAEKSGIDCDVFQKSVLKPDSGQRTMEDGYGSM